MFTKRVIILATAAAAAAVAGTAFAGGTAGPVSIDFSTPSIDLTGGPVTDTITISGLSSVSQAVTGYDLFIDFDNSNLSAGGITQTPLPDDTSLLGGPQSNITGGVIQLSDFSPDGDSAFAGAGDSFVIGSIVFTPLGGGTGTSSPTFDLADSQVLGLEAPECLSTTAAVPASCPYPVVLTFSSGPVSAPEPSTLALLCMSLGAIGIVAVRRRRATGRT